MPKKYWRMSGAKKGLRTDKTEEAGLVKNSKTTPDLDLTEEAGLFKNGKTNCDIRMTEETGLLQNSKTMYDPEEPALRKQKKNRKTNETCSMNLPNELCDMNLSNETCEMNLQNELFEKGLSEATSVTGCLHSIISEKSSEFPQRKSDL
jgi:hypothetical protein